MCNIHEPTSVLPIAFGVFSLWHARTCVCQETCLKERARDGKCECCKRNGETENSVVLIIHEILRVKKVHRATVLKSLCYNTKDFMAAAD